MTDRDSSHRETIPRLLQQIDRRLRRNEALELLSLGAWGFVGLLVLLRLSGAWAVAPARFGLLLLFVAGCGAFVVWRTTRERGLLRSATVADEGADLKDTLKSSISFLGLDERTDWMELQIDRGAETASELSASELAPIFVPPRLYYATGVGTMLFVLFSWNPGWLTNLEQAEFLTASQRDQVEHLEELLDEAQALAPEEEKLEELADALEKLRRRDIELAEGLLELSEAQQALAASQTDLESLQMDLEELGKELEAAPALGDLSDALKSQDAAEAAELLRELAERLSEGETSEELQALLESLQNANVQNPDLAEMMENLENAAGEMTPQDLAQMAQALESMAEQLESMGQQMAAQQDMDQMGQELQELQASLGQQQPSQSQEGGEQQQAAGQAMQNQAGMMSSQMQMAQMQGDPSSAVPVDAGPAGDTTGPGGGGDEEIFGEATTLDVQLEMEMLSPIEESEPVPEEIFERLSREEKSTLNYEDVRGRSSYAEESSMKRDSVPWQYRSLVKRYFLSILTDAESTTQP